MRTLTEEQQKIFDSETFQLEHEFFSVSNEFIEALGFKFVRFHQMKNLRGDEAELEIFEDATGRKFVKLCVTQFTHTEGDLLHNSCYASAEMMPLIEMEHNKYL
ncbi:MAG: hypothetical protein AB9834_01785 [Lentimicrobium sp.]